MAELGWKRLIFGAWRWLARLTRPSRRRNLRRLQARGEKPGELRIREATAADIPALARLHVITWHATYAPLLLRGPSVQVRERQWREAFARREDGWFCSVVERPGGELVGLCLTSRRRQHPGTSTSVMDSRAAHLIAWLQLAPHPEGGHFREVYRSVSRVQPLDERPSGPR